MISCRSHAISWHGIRPKLAAGSRFSPAAEQALPTHSWRGNVRELENAIKRAVVLSLENLIGPEDLLEPNEKAQPPGAEEGTLQKAVDRAVASRITAALKKTGGNGQTPHAPLASIATLYRFLKRLALERNGSGEEASG